MIDLIKLNDEIKAAEFQLLENTQTAVENKKSIEVAKFTFKNNLDKKEYSNEDKRELAALNEPGIKSAVKNLQDFEYQNKVLVIELEHKKRLLNILLKLEVKV